MENTEPLEFRIYAVNGYVNIRLGEVYGFPNETCHFGGYDTKSTLEVKSNGFGVSSDFYISTGDIHSFHEQLRECHVQLTGKAKLESYELNLKLDIKFNDLGQAFISGEFRDYLGDNNMKFSLGTDQSYLTRTLEELSVIEQRYGGYKGIVESQK